MAGNTSAKHANKRFDRLLGNALLHRERIDIYRWHAQLTCSLNPFPFVLIDWADVREQLRMMTLRASIA
ncbi:IS4 family transposase, partial [Motilimonas eburnea]|nr:IS4 family transposase [Motilimonas eburnea]